MIFSNPFCYRNPFLYAAALSGVGEALLSPKELDLILGPPKLLIPTNGKEKLQCLPTKAVKDLPRHCINSERAGVGSSSLASNCMRKRQARQ